MNIILITNQFDLEGILVDGRIYETKQLLPNVVDTLVRVCGGMHAPITSILGDVGKSLWKKRLVLR